MSELPMRFGGDHDPDGKNVYIIEHEHGYVKIGVSDNPSRRAGDLQTGCPYEIQVIGQINTREPFAVESHLHDKYERRQKRGEWYDLTAREKARLISLCDMDQIDVDRRYAKSAEQRRELALTLQGLVG